MSDFLKTALEKIENIRESTLTIYDAQTVENTEYWLILEELEAVLNDKMTGISFEGVPIKTRSKQSKQVICDILGYPIPKSFKKTKPRFLCQNFDLYNQKAINLQIWNEEVDVLRRYVLVIIGRDDIVKGVKVLNGQGIAKLDKTGTLTGKYQAKLDPFPNGAELFSKSDTETIAKIANNQVVNLTTSAYSPIDTPNVESLLSIDILHSLLKNIVGKTVSDPSAVDERLRGAAIHEIVCSALGYKEFKDAGTFPDITHQILEIKLQTSPTIDLGVACPDDKIAIDLPLLNENIIYHYDARYLVVTGVIEKGIVRITGYVLTTGTDFFSRMKKFGGMVVNKKLQIPLPKSFWD